MKNENTTDAICVCGHKRHMHGINGDLSSHCYYKADDCRCKSFTHATSSEVIKDLTVYAVQFSNYQPPEIDSLWTSKSDAKNHSETLDGSWEVTSMTVYGALSPATSGESEGVELTIQLIEAHPSAERLRAALNHGVITYADIKQLTESLAAHAEQTRELKLERDSMKRKVEAAEAANRYALTTFRALDQYTFQDSDHGLLISEAVKKLEDDPLKEMEGLPS